MPPTTLIVDDEPLGRSTPAIRANLFEPTESFGQQSVLTVPSVQFVKAFDRLVKIYFSQHRVWRTLPPSRR
jgi:hypothetical protein